MELFKFFKVSKRDFDRFCSRVQLSFPFESCYHIDTKQPNGVIVTSVCFGDVEVAQRVKPVGRRFEYMIDPFFKEA